MSKKEIKEVEVVDEAPVSKSKAEFKKIMEVYKSQNPVKFALKKAELERKLAAL